MRVLDNYDENNTGYNVSRLDIIVLLEKSQRQVTSVIIHNSFHYTGLQKDALLEGKEANVEEHNLPKALWVKRHAVSIYPRGVTEYFKSFDDEVCTSSTPTETNIVFVFETEQKNDDEKELDNYIEELSEIFAPSISEMKSAANILNFFSARHIDQKLLDSLLIF